MTDYITKVFFDFLTSKYDLLQSDYILMNGCQGIFAGRLFDLGYFKATLIVCSAFMTVANFLIAECTKYWHFVLCQGILLGVSTDSSPRNKLLNIIISVVGWMCLYSLHCCRVPLVLVKRGFFLCFSFSLQNFETVNRRRPLAFALVAFGASVGGIVYPIMIRNLLPRVG